MEFFAAIAFQRLRFLSVQYYDKNVMHSRVCRTINFIDKCVNAVAKGIQAFCLPL